MFTTSSTLLAMYITDYQSLYVAVNGGVFLVQILPKIPEVGISFRRSMAPSLFLFYRCIECVFSVLIQLQELITKSNTHRKRRNNVKETWFFCCIIIWFRSRICYSLVLCMVCVL